MSRTTQIDLIKKSVHQVLKEEAKPGVNPPRYDLIYCAGIFDYLSDRICKRLMNIFYSMLEPGGLLIGDQRRRLATRRATAWNIF